MIEYLVEPQVYIDTDNIAHKGKMISAVVDNRVVGRTGYVEWKRGIYQDNGLNTARLKIANDTFEIWVNEQMRGQHLGEGLIGRLFKELTQGGYNQLVILGATQKAKGFYDRMFEKLIQTGQVSSFYSRIRYLFEIPDFVYDVRIF
ncbi:MAG: GNAT family N-acetyltransferase [Candidatus Aenigmatarchaeota archaeon]